VFTRWLQAYVVNALSTAPSEVRKQIRSLRESQPAALVFVLLDEASPEVVRAAFEAGATDFVGAAAASNPAALHWRISQIVGAAWSRKLVGWWQKSGSGPGSDIERGELEEPGEEEVAEALANVRAGLKRVRTASQALRAAAKLVTVLAPELRAESSGRFDAKKIAERLGISVNRLAPATGVSQQALSKRPDSPRAQKAFASMARALTALSELYSAEEAKMWLNTPHPGLGNEPPLVRILDGRADAVARMLERTLEGIPD
jgi:DNA-binding NarL/FixJ family response regulator